MALTPHLAKCPAWTRRIRSCRSKQGGPPAILATRLLSRRGVPGIRRNSDLAWWSRTGRTILRGDNDGADSGFLWATHGTGDAPDVRKDARTPKRNLKGSDGHVTDTRISASTGARRLRSLMVPFRNAQKVFFMPVNTTTFHPGHFETREIGRQHRSLARSFHLFKRTLPSWQPLHLSPSSALATRPR